MRHRIATAALAVALAACFAPVAAAIEPPPPPPVQSDATSLDDVTRRVFELERTVDDLRAEQTSIDNRILVMTARVEEQSADLSTVKTRLKDAERAFNDRAVAMYRFTALDELVLLLDARSFTELLSRVVVLGRVIELDRQALEEASVVAQQAETESGVLDDMRAETEQLRDLKTQRAAQIENATAEQKLYVGQLSVANLDLLAKMRLALSNTRRLWEAASVPLDARIRKVPGTVLPYTDRTYLVSENHPRRFRTTGVTYNAVTAGYGPGFQGLKTASGQTYNQNDFTCASRNLPFGTWLALSRGNRRIVVVVDDRGPYATGQDLEISEAAARALGFGGTETLSVEVVKPVAGR